MRERWNALQWDGEPGHYEVYYLTLTEPRTGVGFWIRYTMVAPLPGTGESPTCSLWFMAMDRSNPTANVGHKVSLPIAEMSDSKDPFELRIGEARLNDHGMSGSIEKEGGRYTWDLRWQPTLPAYAHVHPALRAARIAKTILFLPHPDLVIEGTIDINGRKVEISGAHGGQAHLWGSKHAARWAWAHCNDFMDSNGNAVGDTFFDGVSVFVPRFGRQIGPTTPVVARIDGRDLVSNGPIAVQRNRSDFDLTHWSFSAREGRRRLTCAVRTRIEDLVGVTYHDPDGDLAYCYNTEVADVKLELFERAARRNDWSKIRDLRSNGHGHFEYAQREPIEGASLQVG
ncbi:MAG: hypothetical protein WDZ37_03435 [Solirubrobacterales bacterium]